MILTQDSILYFTGTGNCLQVAKDINDSLGAFELKKITSNIVNEQIEVKSKTFGIVFPVYYLRVPAIVEKVVKNLEIDKDTYVFAVATHGGLPGASLQQLEGILKDNNNQLNSGFLIQMPGNYVMGYGAKPIERQNKDFKNEKEKVKEISSIIKQKKTMKSESSKLFITKLLTKALKISSQKVHAKDMKFWVNDSCEGCGICEKVCPVKNINFDNNKPVWKHNCEQCTACIQYCPKEALQWGQKTIKRKRYRNPNIKITELINENKTLQK